MPNSTERPSVTEDNESRKDCTTSSPAVIKTPPQPDDVVSKEADNVYIDVATFEITKPVWLFTPEESKRFAAYERQYFNRRNKNCHGCDICLVDKDLPGTTKPAPLLSPEKYEGHQPVDKSHDDKTYRGERTFGRTKPVSLLSSKTRDYETHNKSSFDDVDIDVATFEITKPVWLFTPEESKRFAAYERKYFNRRNKNCHGCDICLVDKDLPGTTKPAPLLSLKEHERYEAYDKEYENNKKKRRISDICLDVACGDLPGTTKPAPLLSPEKYEGHQPVDKSHDDKTYRGERTFGQTKPVSLLSSKTRELYGFYDESLFDDISSDVASLEMKPRWMLTPEEYERYEAHIFQSFEKKNCRGCHNCLGVAMPGTTKPVSLSPEKREGHQT